MKIKSFRIENFRNIRLAECTDPPDFMVICGGNGCGKSALLQALMTAKEHAGAYGNFRFDPRTVSADSDQATISMALSFAENERDFVQKQFNIECPETDEVVIEIKKGGSSQAVRRSRPVRNLLSYYSRSYLGSPGFFDYIEEYRHSPKTELKNWDASFLSDANTKQTLSGPGNLKFQFTKQYLAGLVMRDIQQLQASQRAGKLEFTDSLEPIKKFFDAFFAPMKFVDVLIHESPFKFIISTPRGNIDIDDLSAGEKEVLNSYIRFHQLNPKGAIILFDEADAHLHPDLERRYLEVLREIGQGNQLWLTTHSPEMMIAAGTESLYTVLKEPISQGGNQFMRVTNNEDLHAVLSEVMGSRGLVSFNQRIIFIEGEESSADREVYERLYPPGTYNVSFVPAGNSATVRKTAERVNELLSSSIEFQHYYSIVDGDIERSVAAPSVGNRLFQLPVYHIENFLLDEDLIFEASKEMLGSQCPYNSAAEVESALKEILLDPVHMNPYTAALLDSRLAKLAKDTHNAIYNKVIPQVTIPSFEQTQKEAAELMKQAVQDGTWRKKCKGRDVLKGFCGKNQLRYQHFRNCLIAKMSGPPQELVCIMNKILGV